MNTEVSRSVCIFTIVSNNYLHYANTLFADLTRHCPEADLVLGLCDRPLKETYCPTAVDIIPIEDLDIPQISTFIYQYSILELNTAIKPYLIETLMKRGYSKVIYFDPDIRIFHSLDEMLALLDQHNIILTPHLTDLLDDGKLPSEHNILQAGSYNLGYIGISNCDETLKLAKWWQRKLYKDCVIDLSRGLFVDQKWMDLVPSMFSGVHIHRDTTWNVAYWNLSHRDLQQPETGHFTVDGNPLTFFHFSGYSSEATTLSKHQNRFKKDSNGSSLRDLCLFYDKALLRNGIQKFKNLHYSFSKFADGIVVPDAARQLIRNNVNLRKIDYFDTEECPRIHAEMNRANNPKGRGILLTNLTLSLWHSRPDLQTAFPDVQGIDSIRYAQWLIANASREACFDEIYLQPVRQSLSLTHQKNNSGLGFFFQTLRSKLFQFLWRQRLHTPEKVRFLLIPFSGWILSNAFPRQVLRHPKTEALEILPSSRELGINLIGYLHAESGVGEAARASLRALRNTGLPFSLVDYRLGNTSRMREEILPHKNKAWYPINLMHVNADQSKIAREALGPEIFKDRYTIGYWFWEMPEFPKFLHFAYQQVDEIWVASEYNRTSISQHTNKPVVVIPPSIEVTIDKPLSRSELQIKDDAFVFLHISDMLSVPERKNPLGVIEAFIKAFAEHPDKKVQLIVKLSNLNQQPDLTETIREILNNEPRIKLIQENFDRNTLNNLINTCDCYVSLHRAEGFGLTIAEAMFLGKPVIATFWSGNIDFMTENNSLPVKYELIELKQDCGPYKKGELWAEPDIDDAAKRMHDVVSNTTQPPLNILKKDAAQTIRAKYSAATIAEKIHFRAKEIQNLALNGSQDLSGH